MAWRGRRESSPPAWIVLTEGEQAQACMNYLQAWLKRDQEIAQFHSMFEGKVPAAPEPAPAQTPTEAQRAEVFAQLTRDGLVKRVKDGKDKLEAARARVRLEEAAVEELEKEFKTVSEQVEAHKAEDLRRAEEAKGPRVVEAGSDNDMEGCSSTGEDWFKKHFLGDDADEADIPMHDGERDEFDSDKSDFNARATSAPTQEDVANTPCG